MGSCTRRHFLLSICFLQLLSIIERQVFDFLGYMWAPILVNFFHIIFVIFGFFGAYQLRAKYVVTYSIWTVCWIGWNTFLICFYLNIGILDRDSDILNLGTGSVSWFEINGYGCKPTFPTNITSEDPFRPVRPETVDGCLLDYPTIEVIQAAVQCGLALLGLIGAICLGRIFIEEDDSFDFMNGDAKSPQHTAVHPMYVSYTSLPTSASATLTSKMSNNNLASRGSTKAKSRQSLYSIEFSPPVDAIRGHTDDLIDYQNEADLSGPPLSPKPMTPRRVKRRSVMTRGTTNRQSTNSRRSHSNNHSNSNNGNSGGGSHSRSSVRNSRRKIHQNPVTKLMEQQQQQQLHLQQKQLQQQHHHHHHHLPIKPPYPNYVETGSNLTVSNLKSLNNDLLNVPTTTTSSSFKPAKILPPPPNINTAINSYPMPNNLTPDPIYYNMNQNVSLLQQTSWNSGSTTINTVPQGHYNQSYQHSTPNLNQSPDIPDEVYNNRPPSVRSSYSNFHGARPLSSYNPQPVVENVFAGLGNQLMPPPSQSNTSNNLTSQPLPQVPQRRSASRESVRSMAFLNSGPPAYNLNYHTPPDSETTM